MYILFNGNTRSLGGYQFEESVRNILKPVHLVVIKRMSIYFIIVRIHQTQ